MFHLKQFVSPSVSGETPVRPRETGMPDALDDLLDVIDPREAFRCLTALLPEAAVFVVDGDRNVVH